MHMLDWHLHMVVVACNGSVCNSCVRWCGRCAGERVYTPKDDGCQPRKWKGKPCRLPYLDMHTACELRAFHLTNGVQGCAVCMCTQRKGCIFSTQPPPSRSLAHPFTEPHLRPLLQSIPSSYPIPPPPLYATPPLATLSAPLYPHPPTPQPFDHPSITAIHFPYTIPSTYAR